MTDAQAINVQNQWKSSFPDASLLPVIGLPSNAKGTMTLTHTLPMPYMMTINGLTSHSPLVNNALYTAELSPDLNGKLHWLNLYEVMLPDIPGVNGAPSTCQRYMQALASQGLDIDGVHFHWFGFQYPGASLIAAIHHSAIDLNPEEFTKRTIAALQSVIPLFAAQTQLPFASSTMNTSATMMNGINASMRTPIPTSRPGAIQRMGSSKKGGKQRKH